MAERIGVRKARMNPGGKHGDPQEGVYRVMYQADAHDSGCLCA